MYVLLDSYFEATSGLLDLFMVDEIDSLVAERAALPSRDPSDNTRRKDFASLDVALAIGAETQPRSMRRTEPHLQVGLFSRARQVAFEDMLASPSVEMVRLFLLMSFYMLGICSRNSASMYLGVASQAADVLGLSGNQRRDSRNEDILSLRISKSLAVINILASFILGRRPSTAPASTEPSTFVYVNSSAAGNNQSTFSAILEGCLRIEKIVQSLRTRHILHVPTAESLLEQLRCWTQSLSGPVRQFTFSQDGEHDSAERQSIIGHVHLLCVYYFSVILITRPFLIAYLLSRLRGRAPDHLMNDPDEAADTAIKNSKVSKLAQVCVSSAICMMESLQKVKRSPFLFGNLCFLRAWVFGSGLVLGFSMFAGEPRLDIQEAFEGALNVLDEIGTMCPQARAYHGILADFAEAVSKYRQLVALEIRKTVLHYLDPTPFLEISREKNQQVPIPFAVNNVASDIGGSNMQPSGTCGEPNDVAMDIGLQIIWPDLDLRTIDDTLLATMQPVEEAFYSAE
ncbi:hypothetical protein S7711_07159 [Stachybotrys chartarum IBT 7711]|uniref:Xylanolytic transcriptional activator regulatory domain-containing protein n=1 Tax=Stachybotrys chartarum (strain CBS 109288 / IBT 7711) TaxID=1280523 RepID=A0A084BAH7_STACB|nr:hypothetical protein S7711_07159 [Stachybotrys chartarum IBT 7711]